MRRSRAVGCWLLAVSFIKRNEKTAALYENYDEDEDEDEDAKGASVAFGPFGRRTLFATPMRNKHWSATAARSISAACDSNAV